MTRQRWWSTSALRRIRLGVEVGRYHARFPFDRRYREVLRRAVDDGVELALYERALLSGYQFVAGRP